ncbi:MAG TPA: sigma-70 family RNA polymerase sigma factor [Polyangia bacterium]
MTVDIESLYQAHGPMVLRRCRRLLRDEGRAQDAMHDVFVEILRRKDSLDDRAPASLLLTTATNVCLNRLRTQRRHPEDLQGDSEDALLWKIASAADGGPEARSLAKRALEKIFGNEPSSTALIAVLHHVDHLTLEEVAAEVGMSVSGVRKRLRVLKDRLALPEGAAP